MKVVEITKRFSSGIKTHHLVIPDVSLEGIEELVENWCDTDVAGYNSGYTSEWKYITDESTIAKVIARDIANLDSTIEVANKRRAELVNF